MPDQIIKLNQDYYALFDIDDKRITIINSKKDTIDEICTKEDYKEKFMHCYIPMRNGLLTIRREHTVKWNEDFMSEYILKFSGYYSRYNSDE